MLHLRVVSDLHLEHTYDSFYSSSGAAERALEQLIPHLPTDQKTVLIVAGDLATVTRVQRIVTFMELVTKRFLHVIYVLGNHEHYGYQLELTKFRIEQALKESKIDTDKITVADHSMKMVVIKDVTFLLSTLWTSYGNGDPIVHKAVRSYINDHNQIRALDVVNGDGPAFNIGPVMATPAILARHHNLAVENIRKAGLAAKEAGQNAVVVTHHLPSFQCVHPDYMETATSRLINHAFATNLDDLILEIQPAYWFFGHTHTKYEGTLGITTLYCNPLGYPNEVREKEHQGQPYDSTRVFSL